MAKRAKRKVEWWGIWRECNRDWLRIRLPGIPVAAVAAFPSYRAACKYVAVYHSVANYTEAKRWCVVLRLSAGEPELPKKRTARG